MKIIFLSEDELFEQAESHKNSSVGILIGHITKAKEYAMYLIPTPSEGSASVSSDWLLAHAKQVIRSLPGGLQVTGFYVTGDQKACSALEKSIISSREQLLQLNSRYNPFSEPEKFSTVLVLHLISRPRRVMCREFKTSDQGLPTAVEIKKIDKAPTLVPFTSKLKLSIDDCLFDQSVKGFLQEHIKSLESRLSNSNVLIDGFPPSNNSAEINLGKGSENDTELDYHMIDILLPASQSPSIDDLNSEDDDDEDSDTENNPSINKQKFPQQNQAKKIIGKLNWNALVKLLTYVHPNDLVGEVIQSLHNDAMRTFITRTELLSDELKLQQEENEKQSKNSDEFINSTNSCVFHTFPRRIFWKLSKFDVYLTDYLSQGEEIEELFERCEVMMGATLPIDLIENESFGEKKTAPTQKKDENPKKPKQEEKSNKKEENVTSGNSNDSTNNTQLAIAGSALTLIIAGVVAWLNQTN